jgi:murein DD-endopeptidase MepM/ murein hydrolase activator NlpD
LDNSRRRCYRALSVFNLDNKAVTAMWRATLRLCPVALIFAIFVPGASAWTWPVRGPVLETFSFDPAHPYAAGQHRGIAIGADGGTPVLAPASGVVSFAGTVPTNGLTVTIQTADGLAVSLTHLGSVGVDRSARIAEGAAVGTVGPSGTAEFPVPYVHLGIRTASNDQGYLDPLGFLPALPAPAPKAAAGPAPESASEAAPGPAPEAAAGPAP